MIYTLVLFEHIVGSLWVDPGLMAIMLFDKILDFETSSKFYHCISHLFDLGVNGKLLSDHVQASTGRVNKFLLSLTVNICLRTGVRIPSSTVLCSSAP